MERAGLLERERRSLEVPEDYGAYLRFIRQKGAEIYYNTTMALPYQIDPEPGRYPGPGITLGPGMTFGFIAAQHAHRSLRRTMDEVGGS